MSRTAAGPSSLPAFSADGQYLAFVSQAPNLVTNDDGSLILDVFLRNLASSNMTLVSVNMSGVGGGDRHSSLPSVSSNGQYVVFESAAGNLAPNDTNGASDIFVRDTVAGMTLVVSVASSGAAANGASGAPLMSTDGRFVAFESTASDLVANDLNDARDVFVRDLVLGVTSLVSVNMDQASELLRMTADGRLVAFASSTNGKSEVFVKDLQADITYWVTRNIQTPQFDARRFEIDLSENGQYVALHHVVPWAGAASPGNGGGLYRHELISGSTTNIPKRNQGYHGSGPQISADGQMVAYSHNDGIWTYDFATGTNIFVITNFTEPADLVVIKSFRMSPDFSRIFFTSYSPGYVPTATNRFMHLFVRDLATRETRLLDATTNGLGARGQVSEWFAVSADALWAAFESTASDLVTNDLNRAADIFLRHATSGPVRLVSERTLTRPANTGTALASIHPGAFSANGDRLVFASLDNTLTPNDTNRWQDLFYQYSYLVYAGGYYTSAVAVAAVNPPNSPSNSTLPQITADGRYVFYERHPNASITNLFRANLVSNIHEYVAGPNSPGAASVNSSAASVSQDGRFVAFQSSDNAGIFIGAPSFPDGNGFDIIVRDYGGRTNRYPNDPPSGIVNYIVSLNTAGNATANSASWKPTITLDGEWVLYHSRAQNLVTNPFPASVTQLFAWHVRSRKNKLISLGAFGGTNPVVSADSRSVAFRGTVNSNIYVYDLYDDLRFELCADCANPSLSGDARWITYESQGQVMLYDRAAAAGQVLAPGGSATLSYDGRFVLFASRVGNLVPNDLNGVSDIFLYDRRKETISLISSNYQGTGSANGPSSRPTMSPDAHAIAFQSFASDLVPGDFNAYRDVFVARMTELELDSDRDGMNDEWELEYFNSLAQPAFGDFDSDRQANFWEFRAGTDPTDRFSNVRVAGLITTNRYVGSYNAQETTVFWPTVPGRVYRLQFKTDLNVPFYWQDVPGEVAAAGTTASKLHSASEMFLPAPRHRFYRIYVVLPHPDL